MRAQDTCKNNESVDTNNINLSKETNNLNPNLIREEIENNTRNKHQRA